MFFTVKCIYISVFFNILLFLTKIQDEIILKFIFCLLFELLRICAKPQKKRKITWIVKNLAKQFMMVNTFSFFEKFG